MLTTSLINSIQFKNFI